MKKLILTISLSCFIFGATNEELTIAVAKLIQAQNDLKQKVTVINKKFITNKYYLSKKDKKRLSNAYTLSKKNSKLIKEILNKINKQKPKEDVNISKISKLQEELLILKSNLNKFSKNVSLALQERQTNYTLNTDKCKNLIDNPVLDKKLLDYLKEK